MKQNNRPDFINEEKRADYIKKIISFFLTERNEEMGIVAAGKILDFIIEDIGKDLYKRGVKDAGKLLNDKMEDIKVELDILSPEER